METIGIRCLHVEIPPGRQTAAALVRAAGAPPGTILERVGFDRKAVADGVETATGLATAAARTALQRAGVSPKDVGLIVYASSGVHDAMFWSPAAKLQGILGASDALSFEVNNGCHAGNLGVNLCARYLAGDPTIRHALVVVSDILSGLVDPSDEAHQPILNFADAATALVLSRGWNGNRLIAFAAVTDPSFVDLFHLPRAGTKIVCDPSPELRQRLKTASLGSYDRVIHEVAARGGVELAHVSRFYINQGAPRLLDRLAERLRVSPTKLFKSHRDFGHLGGSDIFLGLEQDLQQGRVREGDYVVLASSAIGFTWGATLLQI